MHKRFISAAIAIALGGCGLFGGGGGGAALSVGPGFSPDPQTVTGNAGGATDASSFGPGCIGQVGSSPSHVLTVTGDIPNLRVMARADQDITLAIRKPDGTFLCNDDSEGLNPVVEGAFPAGNYDVYVGSYATEGQFASYRLGVSVNAATMPSTLPAP